MQIMACTENIWDLVGKETVQCSALSVMKEVSLDAAGSLGKHPGLQGACAGRASWKRTGDTSLEVTRRT